MYIITEEKLKELEERELAVAKTPSPSRESLKIKSILSKVFKISIEEIEECLDYKKNTDIQMRHIWWIFIKDRLRMFYQLHGMKVIYIIPVKTIKKIIIFQNMPTRTAQ